MSTDAGTADGEASPSPAREADATDGSTDADGTAGRVRRSLDYVLVAGLLVLGVVAVVSLYLSASQVITDWVAPQYRSLFRTAFNLVVVLLVGAGLAVQLRRLR